jgi:hypothetical protein
LRSRLWARGSDAPYVILSTLPPSAAARRSPLSLSPIVSVASAVNVDLLRTDLLYRISPLAHLRFEYPVWYSPLLLYGVVLLVSVAGTARSLRKGWL